MIRVIRGVRKVGRFRELIRIIQKAKKKTRGR